MLVLLLGLPAVGKSTLARAIKSIDPQVTIICADEYGSSAPGNLRTRNELVYYRAKELLQRQGGKLVIDDTFHLKAMRKPWFQLAKSTQTALVYVCMEAPVPVLLGRNASRTATSVTQAHIEKMYKEFDSIKGDQMRYLFTINIADGLLENVHALWSQIQRAALVPSLSLRQQIPMIANDTNPAHNMHICLNKMVHEFVLGQTAAMRKTAAKLASEEKRILLNNMSDTHAHAEVRLEFEAVLKNLGPILAAFSKYDCQGV